MSNKMLAALSGLILATSPVLAQGPTTNATNGAPAAGPTAKYCLRVGPVTGSQIEVVRCWTRDEWSEQGVDVDKAWAKDGVVVRKM